MARRTPPPKRQEFSAEDTADALAMFNNNVQATRDAERQRQALGRADRRRKDAGVRVKRLMETDSNVEERAEAEVEYRSAVDEWQQITNGELEPEQEVAESPEGEETAGEPAPDAAPAEEPSEG
ncbi:MAG: hypothetical protein ACKVHU_01880 [Acidimicrobiales bacterium]|jgi:hypothetical protein